MASLAGNNFSWYQDIVETFLYYGWDYKKVKNLLLTAWNLKLYPLRRGFFRYNIFDNGYRRNIIRFELSLSSPGIKWKRYQEQIKLKAFRFFRWLDQCRCNFLFSVCPGCIHTKLQALWYSLVISIHCVAVTVSS